MKKQLILGMVFGVILLGLGFADFARATCTANGDFKLTYDCITPSDLGVTDVGTLPTSRFYFLKQWSRGITRLFTFNSIAEAQLEFKITNQIAAELIEVNKAFFPSGVGVPGANDLTALKNALQNFTNAQERLNSRITAISTDPSDVELAKLLQEVDEKTALHVAVLEQLRVAWYSTGAGEQNIMSVVDEALDNTLKTFTVTFTVTNTGTAPTGTLTVQQKATDEIVTAEDAITAVYGWNQSAMISAAGLGQAGYVRTTWTTADRCDGTLAKCAGTSADRWVMPDDWASSITGPDSVTWTVVTNVNISIKPNSGGVASVTSTDQNGFFEFTGLAPGTYDLSVGGQVIKSLTVASEGTISGRTLVVYSDNHGEFMVAVDGTSNRPPTIAMDIYTPGGVLIPSLKQISKDSVYYIGTPNFIVITNAKGHLASAKEAFAEGKYGEAYGLARSAEAMVRGIRVATGDLNGDGVLDQAVPTASPTQSPKIETPRSSPKASASPTVRPTPNSTQTPTPTPQPICEHAAPPEGCHYEGPDTYPVCGAYLVCPTPTPTPTENPMGTVTPTPTPTETGSAL